MYIEALALENVRTFVSARIKFVHPDRHFTRSPHDSHARRLWPRPRLCNVNLLLGDNAAGKTTILRAIAAACTGPAASALLHDDPTIVRVGETTARIFANLTLHEQDHAPGTKLNSDIEITQRDERISITQGQPDREYLWDPVYHSRDDALFVAGYGATRRVEQLDVYDPGARSRAQMRRDQRVLSLFRDSFSLVPLPAWLPELESRNPVRYAEVVNLINRLLPPSDIVFTGVRALNGDYVFDRGGSRIPFQSISGGFRAFIGWIGDLLFHVFGGVGDRPLATFRGIVLVDEIDLHLHPSWQMTVIETLSAALPKVQFIVTSHSPIITGSLEWMNIVKLTSNPRSNRTTTKRIRESVHGLDADQVLLTSFFGLKTTRAPGKISELDELRRKARHGDREAARELVRAMSRGTEESK